MSSTRHKTLPFVESEADPVNSLPILLRDAWERTQMWKLWWFGHQGRNDVWQLQWWSRIDALTAGSQTCKAAIFAIKSSRPDWHLGQSASLARSRRVMTGTKGQRTSARPGGGWTIPLSFVSKHRTVHRLG
jgi:hypothetical protein